MVPPPDLEGCNIPALAIWTPEDGLLGAVAPLGLAVAAGNALVVDLDPGGPRYPGVGSLAALVAEGPRRSDLTPRPGVAVLRNGGIAPGEAVPVVQALIEAHPLVVLRLPPRPRPEGLGIPLIPVRLLVPGSLFEPAITAAVFQATPAWQRLPVPGVRLPVPSPATVAGLVVGRRPPGRDRWIAAWRRALGFPWGR